MNINLNNQIDNSNDDGFATFVIAPSVEEDMQDLKSEGVENIVQIGKWLIGDFKVSKKQI